MNYDDIYDNERFHAWAKYEPNDIRYARYAEKDPSLIATAHKVVDVYHCFADARFMSKNACMDNWGKICAQDELSIRYTKSQFLISAILQYSICVDLSWQVIWAYFQPSSLTYLINKGYNEMEKNCTSESLHSQLNCAMAQEVGENKKAEIINNRLTMFENNQHTKKMRELYNGIKHRGTIHIVGLGENVETLRVVVQGKRIPKLHRKSYTTEGIEEMIYNFDKEFECYFNSIIEELIPEEYMSNTCTLGELMLQMLNMAEEK